MVKEQRATLVMQYLLTIFHTFFFWFYDLTHVNTLSINSVILTRNDVCLQVVCH